MKKSEIIICGAGIAGVACAYYLSELDSDLRIVLIDKLQPLSLTTSKSGENFREYWPQPAMNEFVGKSIALMENLSEVHNAEIDMRYFGYDFVCHNKGSRLFPTDIKQSRDSFTVVSGAEQIQSTRPYLDAKIEQVFHIKRGGAVDVYALGSAMLAMARKNGVQLVRGEVVNIDRDKGKLAVSLADGQRYQVGKVVLCAGPFLPKMASKSGFELPVYSVPQRKIVMPDPQKVIPRNMPFTIFAEPQFLHWTDEEMELIRSDADFAYLREEFPAGLHIKPEGRSQIKLGWAFNTCAEQPKWNVDADENFPDIVLRGAARFIPGLKRYINNIPTPVTQFAGYYTRTRDNLPIIGKLDEQLLVVGALSGYGTMAACAAGSLCADYISNTDLPGYARMFRPQRFTDKALMRQINAIQGDGQL